MRLAEITHNKMLFGITAIVVASCLLLFSGYWAISALKKQQIQSSYFSSLGHIEASLQELSSMTPERLTSDEKAFERLKAINSRIINQFQQLEYGTPETSGLPIDLSNKELATTIFENSDKLLATLAAIIQSRQSIHQYLQLKERLSIEANTLVSAVSDLLVTSEKQPLAPEQLKAIYKLNHRVQAHHYKIITGFSKNNSTGHAIIKNTVNQVPEIKSIIKLSMEGKYRLRNPVLRRMFANVLEQITKHSGTIRSSSVMSENHEELSLRYEAMLSTLPPLVTNISNINIEGNSSVFQTLLPSIVATIIAFMLLLARPLLNESPFIYPKGNKGKTAKGSEPVDIEISPQSENTQQRNLFITEKNQLINDIQPVIDGALYVSANENAETTADIARAYNSVRRSLVKRLQLIQQELERVIEPAIKQPPSPKEEDEPDLFDIKTCINLTFDTQAKVEHLRHKLENEGNDANKENIFSTFTANLEALMELQANLRVRLRDFQQSLRPKEPQNERISKSAQQEMTLTNHGQANHGLERLSKLVNSFQLEQTPRSKRNRPLTKPVHPKE